MGYMMWLMMIGMVLVGTVIVAIAILVVRYLWIGTMGKKRKNDAESVLKECLARGEIDPDEYRERLNTLHNPR